MASQIRILIMDDRAIQADVVIDLLSHNGFPVRSFADHREAVVALEQNPAMIALAPGGSLLAEDRRETLIDALTGLYTRSGFDALAERQVKIARREKIPLLLLSIAIRGLDAVRDSQGHRGVDHIIINAADLLRENFRSSDIISYAGNGTFTALAIDTAETALGPFITCAGARLNELVVPRLESADQVSFDIGMAVFDPGAPCGLHELKQQADLDLHRIITGA